MVPHDLLRQVGPPALIHWTREHPTLWRLIRRLAMPFAQSLDQIMVGRNRFLRTFRLADTNNVLHDGARYVNLFGVEVYVFPFQCE